MYLHRSLTLAAGSARSCTRGALLRLLSTQNPSGSEQKPTTTSSDSDVEGYKPMYATKAAFDRKKVEQRFQNAEEGQHPTKWQKRFLVLTKLYQNQQEIPEIVAHGTMNRMHDRMRVVFIITGIFGFFAIFLAGEQYNARRIARDRDAGVIVTKM